MISLPRNQSLPRRASAEEIPQRQMRLRETRLHDRQVWQAARLRLLWDHRRLLLVPLRLDLWPRACSRFCFLALTFRLLN